MSGLADSIALAVFQQSPRTLHQLRDVIAGKLAEQQGPYIGMPVGDQTVARAVASLDQSLTFAQDFRAEDVRVVLAALAATGKQQVGEVQGDALACIERIEEAIEHRVPHEIYGAVHVELAELRALAARQPGAQVPVTGPYLDEPDAPSNPLWKRLRSIANWLTVLAPNSHMEAAELLLTASARIQRNDAAPPAQGIDLGQFRPVLEQRRDDILNAVPAFRPDGDYSEFNACIERRLAEVERLLAIVDGQRDAAPGVGS